MPKDGHPNGYGSTFNHQDMDRTFLSTFVFISVCFGYLLLTHSQIGTLPCFFVRVAKRWEPCVSVLLNQFAVPRSRLRW